MKWRDVGSAKRARIRAIVLARDNYRCQLQLEGCTTIATQVDHIQPRELAGDTLSNLRGVCLGCNVRRGKPGRTDPDPNPSTAW